MLSLFRIAGTAVIFWFTPFNSSLMQLVTIIVFIVVAVTDAFDGWFARKYGRVTEAGKILDPVADKVLILTFLPLLEMQVITSFPVFVILAREFAISALRIRAAQLRQTVEARSWGKLKTGLTMPLCGILLGRVYVPDTIPIPLILKPLHFLMHWVQNWPVVILNTYVWIVVIITLISFFDYFREYILGYFRMQHMPEDQVRKWKAVIPNTFTLLNFSMGLLATILALLTHYELAVLCIILGIFADAVDGPLARKLNISSKFGARLDSQADLVSFGIAPTVLILRYLYSREHLLMSGAGLLLAAFYFFCTWYRLNRFNKSGHTEFFCGLPSPVGAALVLLSAIAESLNEQHVFPWIVLFSSLLMISHIPYAHLGLVKKRKFFMMLAISTSITSLLTLAKLMRLNLPDQVYAYELLFGVIMLYVISPFFVRQRQEGSGLQDGSP
ncbi:MAG: CDP-diacylglycerol--glycerol-3-phosphate 3-phosphatidyltransferase [Candidatus Wallbacteria bacterium]|nr:CDP-diacylglycerol--glycerol-3-phosphate 3-phosphatidyltransferase [Candidatus Wallbacteria bacterium]